MERTLLYYPTIDIPNEAWLQAALLYSDKIASILPFYDMRDKEVPDRLKFLFDKGEYKPVFIRRLLNDSSGDFKEFEEYFISTVTSPEFCQQNQQKKQLIGGHLEKLYDQKVTSKIRRFLIDRGLLQSSGDDGFFTDETVALFYMGMLAQYVAKTEKTDIITPSTDDKRYETLLCKATPDTTPALSFQLNDCLPVPVVSTPLEKIIAFKHKRRNELLKFRNFLSDVQEKVQKAASGQEIKEIQMAAQENIEVGIAELQALYKDTGITTFFTSFENLQKMEAPKILSTLAAGGVITKLTNPIIGVAAATLGVVATVASSYLKNKNEMNKSEFSYLFKAKKAGIVS